MFPNMGTKLFSYLSLIVTMSRKPSQNFGVKDLPYTNLLLFKEWSLLLHGIRDATYTNLKLFKEWSLLLHGTRDAPYTNLPVTDPHSKVSFLILQNE